MEIHIFAYRIKFETLIIVDTNFNTYFTLQQMLKKKEYKLEGMHDDYQVSKVLDYIDV